MNRNYYENQFSVYGAKLSLSVFILETDRIALKRDGGDD